MQRSSSIALALAVLTLSACESREERMRRQMEFDSTAPQDGNPADEVEKIPADPTRDALEAVLSPIYAADGLPDVKVGDVDAEDRNYAIENPGALAIVVVKDGLSEGDKAKAIIRGVAEADAFAVRNDSELYFSEQLNKIKNSFGVEQRDMIPQVYADLRLLDFFASDAADAAIAKLGGELKTAAEEMKADYIGRKDEIWSTWMGVKLYARRIVAYDQPFKSVLRSLRKQFDMKEPESITWTTAHDPVFAAWAKEIDEDDELFKMLTNLAELRDQEEFRGNTHARWAIQGSDAIPEEAKGVELDAELGFGVYREDLGGGYQEMIMVFSPKLKGNALKEAYLRSLIYRQVFSDFATLSAAGGDFEDGQVPDKHDADYAFCASRMALDGMITDFGDDKAILSGLAAEVPNEDKLISEAVDCVLLRIPEGINRGTPGDDARPPAPATRNALFQMLARFTKVDVDLDNMKKDVEKTAEVEDAEAFLKAYNEDKKKGG
ncbi:hypothetical protein G6O69_06510 [Pseudenhygromyxa sp. WMMC2535]|uniref:hypothetical protein n=1 Tax=Pseudenhygromyxa sp. WMMC2535 TaxID=2712867 RepID=UPI001554B2C1|nr:hypothetical protein [Pseudenhygromyxa sp. WMMC2535]NVB37477.1 hypothetical protein [Pseudenhygromyxa sp. WMMC2535]